jgi:hypothetical protein
VHRGIVRELHCGNGIHRRDDAPPPVAFVVHDDVAREEKSNVEVGGERAVRQRWIAGAKDHVGAKVHIDLLFQRRPDVDLRQHAEALLRQLRADAVDRLVERQVDRRADAVAVSLGQHDSSTIQGVLRAGRSAAARSPVTALPHAWTSHSAGRSRILQGRAARECAPGGRSS